MKKLLDAITREPSSSAFENAEEGTSRRASRGVPSMPRVYDELCIFCVKSSKYQKGQNTRESLIQCSELCADDRIRKAAGIKLDQRMLAITSRELVATEGHYQRSCYRAYTRVVEPAASSQAKEQSGNAEELFQTAEKYSYEELFLYIRN